MTAMSTGHPRIYLDHAATTPPDPDVVEAMLPALREQWHNPSSIYVEAQRARARIDEARATIAALIGAQPQEVLFTSGGSEADNLALRGVLAASRRRGKHIVISAVEHHAILDPAEQLERDGLAEVTMVGVDREGRVAPAAVEAAVRSDTVLVSVMHANNEIGTVNDIAEIARRVRAKNPRTVVHTDAVQSAAHLGVHVDRLGVDLMTFTAHKMYGPRGAGALYVRSGTPLQGQIIGGGQERGIRAGTEDTAAIAGFARAMTLATERREADISHERVLQERLIEALPRAIPMLAITGPRDPAQRLPGNVSCTVGFVEGESILLALDIAGIAASSGSACTTGAVEPSHVLVATGMPDDLARGSLRFTFGRGNTEADIERLLKVLPPIVERLRALSPIPISVPPESWGPWLVS